MTNVKHTVRLKKRNLQPLTRNSTYKQIYNYLVNKYPNKPVILIHERIDQLKSKRKAIAMKKALNTRTHKHWEEVLKPLRAHIQSVLTHQPRHERTNPAYYKFNERYIAILRFTRDIIKDRARKGVYPNPDSYWADYIDESIKEKVHAKYIALPRSTTVHYREIFPKPKKDTRTNENTSD